MRFSLIFMLLGFFSFSLYLAWEQGAFSFQKFELRRQDVPAGGYSQDISLLLNQALKSEARPLKKVVTSAAGQAELLLQSAGDNREDKNNNKTGGSSLH